MNDPKMKPRRFAQTEQESEMVLAEIEFLCDHPQTPILKQAAAVLAQERLCSGGWESPIARKLAAQG